MERTRDRIRREKHTDLAFSIFEDKI
jgi:hypothetical protein